MKIYPAEIVVVFLCALCVTMISAPVCLMEEGNLLAWTLKPDVALVTIIYSVRTKNCGQYQMKEVNDNT